jgi:chitinase
MVSVQGDSPPVVTLTQPTDGATFTSPATVNLAATASDADGAVTKVEFFNGGAKLGEDTTAPYSFSWSGVVAGTYTLTARATDDLGATTTSAAATITVSANTNTPPTANITSPADGAIFAWKPTITVTATASDPDGNVTKVEFRDGTSVLGQDTSAPYSFMWRNVPQGSHVLTVRATDNAGGVTTSSPVGITVRPKR